jgi:hypothetical protein
MFTTIEFPKPRISKDKALSRNLQQTGIAEGVATAGGEYADICSTEWISSLRKSLVTHF